jgi:hypothetical protein
MKNYVLLLITLFIFSAITHASNIWSKFSCNQENSTKNLLFIPEKIGDIEQQCTFFDGAVVWNLKSIAVNQNFYHVSLHSGCSHAYLEAGALSSIEFSLPEDRSIKRRQEGGYYIPVMRTLPLNFEAYIIGRNAQGDIIFSESYNCTGIF